MEAADKLAGLKRPVVKLVGLDGNAFSIMGRVQRACKEAGWTSEQTAELLLRMRSGDYDNLLRVTMDYCDEPEIEEDEDE